MTSRLFWEEFRYTENKSNYISFDLFLLIICLKCMSKKLISIKKSSVFQCVLEDSVLNRNRNFKLFKFTDPK